MLCSISNEVCINPVISKKTGDIFEKSLIEKHLKVHKSCPITSESMTIDDVIEVKLNNNQKISAAPKLMNASSIPQLLKTFQNEWDQLMLESYNLKKKLQDTRQQLTHSMYQYDAAIRVIARLTQERDRALQELANTRESMQSALSQVESMKALHLEKRNANNSNQQEAESDNRDIDMNTNENNNNNNGQSMDVDDADNNNNNKLSETLISSISSTALDLAKMRKKESKKACPELVSQDVIANEYAICDGMSYLAHAECDAGIKCMDLDDEYPHNRIVTGGNDAQIIVYNRKEASFEYVVKGHKAAVNDVLFHAKNKNMVLSASADASCVVWKLEENNKYQQLWNINNMHKDSVIALSVHPYSNEYFLSCSRDGLWCFNSLNKKQTMLKVYNEDDVGFNAMQLHPDGQIVATGSADKKLKIWDIRTSKIGLTFALNKDVENITCCNFNQNGYYLGCGHANGVCNVWDLRKIGKNKSVNQINVSNQTIKAIQFDKSGQYLAIGQPNGIVLYQSKKWNKFAQFQCHNKHITSIRFAQNAKFIVTASLDRYIKILSNHTQ